MWLPGLQEEPLDRFCIEYPRPDIHQHIYKVHLDSMPLPPLSKDERRNLSRCKHFSPDWLNNPILRSQEVRKKLRDLPDSSEDMEVWVYDHHVSIRDFSRNQLHIYYTEKLGGYVPERHAYTPEYYLASNFQQIFSTFLPHFSAFLLHSSGVIRGDRAALFLAPDEGGKTTVIANSTGEPILSGDQIMLRNEGNVIMAHGTPLGGVTSGPFKARLGALFVLDRASKFAIETTAPADLVQCLWAEHRNYTFFLPKLLKKMAFRILCDACYQAPVYMMRFPRDYVDWNAVDAAMEGTVASKQRKATI